MKNVMTGTYIKGNENFNFDFYTELSAANKLRFVNSVVGLLVDDENYDSIIRDLIFDYCIVEVFTNIDTSEISESDFINNAEQFLEETNIVEIVKANMEDGLLEELNKAVDKSIEYRTGIRPSPLNEALASFVSTLEKKVNEIDLGSMMNMAQKFTGMTGELTPESIMNAYMNSDMYKKNLDEIAESKKEKVEIVENLDKAIKSVKDETNTKTKDKK